MKAGNFIIIIASAVALLIWLAHWYSERSRRLAMRDLSRQIYRNNLFWKNIKTKEKTK